MHERVQWWQRDMPPTILGEGKYEAFISASDDPDEDFTPGRSSCAWMIKRVGGPEEIIHSEAKVSHSSESDEQRGFVAATLGVIASLKGHCTVLIHTNNQQVVDALNGGALKWRSNGWHNAQKQPVKNPELWARILELQESRKIEARGIHVCRRSVPELEAVHRMAKQAIERS